MKRLIVSALIVTAAVPAIGADQLVLPTLYSEPQYAPSGSYGEQNPWSRPYVGIFGGIATGDFNYSTNYGSSNSELNLTGGGFEAGLRVGYDYANDNFLAGAIADYALTTIRTGGDLTVGALSGDLEARVTSLGTIRGRIGMTQKNNLFYLHGGAAFGNVNITENGNSIPGVMENTRIGYTIGAGYEYAISSNASFQTEYSYTDLGTHDLYAVGPVKISDRVSFHKIASGFNIRF